MPVASASKDPTLVREQQAKLEGFRFLIGCDEVGRGAIAGPVAVGVALVSCDVTEFPVGLRDSKLLSEKKRDSIAQLADEWCTATAVGYATAAEIDRFGITQMLGVAARRALLDLHDRGFAVEESLIVVDGSHDWLSPALKNPLTVCTQVKADRDCATVAAASVVAKVQRDALMRELHEAQPHYGWNANKGYGSAAHYAAISEHGITEWHRASWIRV